MRAKPDWTEADERAYRNAQRLRAFERAVRTAKQREQAALTPADRLRARTEVRRAQARVRAHVAATGLLRRPRREQLNLGNQ